MARWLVAGRLVARWLGAGGWWLVVGGWWLVAVVPKTQDLHIYRHTDHKHRKKKRTHLFSTRAMGYKVFGKNGELLQKK